MRAYIFWHHAAVGNETARYESALADFHAALNAVPPAGLLGSSTHRIQGVPWLPTGTGYEDWYEIENSAALDVLEAAAISAALRPAHDAVAQMAAGGEGALYRLVSRGAGLAEGSINLWFSRPKGVRYLDFVNVLRSGLPPEWAVWQRQMGLGPSPEFCALGPPGGITGRHLLDLQLDLSEVLQVGRKLVWSSAARVARGEAAAPAGLPVLRSLIAVGPGRLSALGEEAVSRKPGPGRWSPKEELGHLIDSAFNNHQRLVRGQLEDCPQMPGYDGDRWVELHGYQRRRWQDLINLWLSANQQLCQAAEAIPPGGWSRTCTIKGSQPLKLSFVLDDYLRHALHHLRHLGMPADDLKSPPAAERA